MAEEAQTQVAKRPMRRAVGHKKGGKSKKQQQAFQGSREKKVKVDKRMQKLYRKRARDYNSDDDDEEEEEEEEHSPVSKARKIHEPSPVTKARKEYNNEMIDERSSDEEVEERENGLSDEEDGEILPGVTRFMEGCNAFRAAFKKITKTNISDELLGPVLSAHKKLLAEKLADEDAERKVKGEAKKEKHLISEKGHVKPANFLDSHEKFLIGVATKGVVKLFNAVNKAQTGTKGLNPSRSKDAKALRHQRKNTFFSELRKTQSQGSDSFNKDSRSQGAADGEGPAWAPLRDDYMSKNPKLKDWDKMQDMNAVDDGVGRMGSDSSSDED